MDHIFLCGPAEMIFSVKDWLIQKGIDQKKIHYELFLTPGQPTERIQQFEVSDTELDERSAQITVKLDGSSFGFELPYKGDSILDAALRLGADLPFACKGGVCATCKAKLISGEVQMDMNYSLEQEELRQGFILTCQSHPRTQMVTVDFDAR